jgi:hypothetical protein
MPEDFELSSLQHLAGEARGWQDEGLTSLPGSRSGTRLRLRPEFALLSARARGRRRQRTAASALRTGPAWSRCGWPEPAA